MENKSENMIGLSWAQRRVRDFHESAGHPVGLAPAPLAARRLASRIAWMREELDELEAAQTLVDQADAVIDLIYFAVGTLVEMGLDGEKLFTVVHEANMRKITSSGVNVRNDGKVQKPQGWVTPESEMASSIVSSYSHFELVRAEQGDSCTAVLEMISNATGSSGWLKERFAQILPPLSVSPGSIEPYLAAAGVPLRETFIPINVIDEASFEELLQSSLSKFPGVVVAYQLKQAYRSGDVDLRYGIVDKIYGDYVQVIDPGPNDPGIHAVNIYDLYAGVKSAMDGVHQLEVRQQ